MKIESESARVAARALAVAVLVMLALGVHAAGSPAVPDWLYPSNSPPLPAPPRDPASIVRLPGSSRTYSESQLVDLFSAPDWGLHPHGPMPPVVSHGRQPNIRACGFCHTPTGQGRPENAALAGLPRVYLAAQLQDFRSGRRRAAWPGSYPPADLMILAAQNLTDEEIEASADYFAGQHPVARVEVQEAVEVPRFRVEGLVYVAVPAGGNETLGQRLLEFTPDAKRHEERDDAMHYIAYVPPGSLDRGRLLALKASSGPPRQACAGCHGVDLRGANRVPGIAGRSPTYLLRSLYAFRTGARAAPSAQPMRALTAQLTPRDMLDAAAYAGSLPP